MTRLLALLLILSTPAFAAEAPILTGRASVVDGDTIEIHGNRIRLHGIDAPESGQLCLDARNRKWRCGQKSAQALDKKIGRKTVSCRINGRDRYGRHIANCYTGATNLNAWMVQNGWAIAYLKYAQDYVAQEQTARNRRSGIWQGRFVQPDQWRKGARLSTDAVARADTRQGACVIKGNISSKGKRIYHLPGTEWYSRTRISEHKGERWFCSEAEARAAGWRKAR
ncbi:thermonuclease family protein [Shimia sp. SDUM112013]|uniref:thermonuclease family protein n=1 Tax=Shimia sp. SDUM112013 TaxID=3136160 RepID=UPI0032EDD8A8